MVKKKMSRKLALVTVILIINSLPFSSSLNDEDLLDHLDWIRIQYQNLHRPSIRAVPPESMIDINEKIYDSDNINRDPEDKIVDHREQVMNNLSVGSTHNISTRN